MSSEIAPALISKWEEQAKVLSNRIKKRHLHLRKWAKRTDVSCFRVYDQDIPELPFQVDIYGKFVHMSELVRFHEFDDDVLHDRWTGMMADSVWRTLGLPKENLYLKTRKRQKQLDQYEKFSSEARTAIVSEGGLQFEVNLSDYLDTGLFLDHRISRQFVRDLALGARVLNLFSYTGSFSVYAAAGGATSTLSVDLSNTYTEWAQRNLALNGFTAPAHECRVGDVLSFLGLGESTPNPKFSKYRGEPFDLIVLDPPTFSNSKKMSGVLDVQRDHVRLIRAALGLLTKNGVLFFSNNFKKFKPDKSLQDFCKIEEITNSTVPEDFARKRPHRSFLIRKVLR